MTSTNREWPRFCHQCDERYYSATDHLRVATALRQSAPETRLAAAQAHVEDLVRPFVRGRR